MYSSSELSLSLSRSMVTGFFSSCVRSLRASNLAAPARNAAAVGLFFDLISAYARFCFAPPDFFGVVMNLLDSECRDSGGIEDGVLWIGVL